MTWECILSDTGYITSLEKSCIIQNQETQIQGQFYRFHCYLKPTVIIVKMQQAQLDLYLIK